MNICKYIVNSQALSELITVNLKFDIKTEHYHYEVPDKRDVTTCAIETPRIIRNGGRSFIYTAVKIKSATFVGPNNNFTVVATLTFNIAELSIDGVIDYINGPFVETRRIYVWS